MPVSNSEEEANEYWRKSGEESARRRVGSYQELLAKVLSRKEDQLPNAGDDSIKEGEEIFSGTREDIQPDSPDSIAAQSDLNKQAVHDRIADRKLRIDAAETLLALTKTWIIWLFVLLLLKGFLESFSFTSPTCTISIKWFSLPDPVAIALISATSVFGLLGIVLKYLFNNKEKN
jgi:hypothetical protein